MLNTIAEWFSVGLRKPLALSIAAVIVCVMLYWILRRRLLAAAGRAPTGRLHLRLLAVIVTLLAVIGMVRAWQGHSPLADAIHGWFHGNAVYTNLIWTFLGAIVLYFVWQALSHTFQKNITEIDARHKLRRGISWSVLGVFVIWVAFIWANRIENLGVFLGILGAGVALSLQETLLCIAGWMLAIVYKPFDIGDRIEVNGLVGDVIDIRVFQTSVLEVGNWVHGDQSTGRIISVPNSTFFRHSCRNYTKGFPFIWNEIRVTVTFESDYRRAKELMLQQAEQETDRIEKEVSTQIQSMQRQYAIHYTHLTPIIYTEIAECGVALTLRYLVPVRKRRASVNEISERILDAFAGEPRVDLAYPTMHIRHRPDPAPPETAADLAGGEGAPE